MQSVKHAMPPFGMLRSEHHSEFVVGLDFNLFVPGQVATCSWDGFVAVFDVRQGPVRPIPPVKMAGAPVRTAPQQQ